MKFASGKKKANLTSIIGASLTKKARNREEMAVSIILATSWSVAQLAVWRNRPCSPEWICHKAEWETSGSPPKRIYRAGCIHNQAFPAVPTFLGIFSSKGLEGSSVPHLFVTHGFFVLHRLFKKSWTMLFHRTVQDLLVKCWSKGA